MPHFARPAAGFLFLSSLLMASVVLAGQPESASAPPSPRRQTVLIPSTDYEVVVVPRHQSRRGAPPTAALLGAIVVWLSRNFPLPENHDYPQIRMASAAAINTFRHTGLLSDKPPDRARVPPGQRAVVAVYDKSTKTILLPMDWNGRTAAQLSVLVHEMVHHLQHLATIQYDCPQSSEALAYAAQAKWLALFGRDLMHEFQLDGFTLLVTTQCSY